MGKKVKTRKKTNKGVQKKARELASVLVAAESKGVISHPAALWGLPAPPSHEITLVPPGLDKLVSPESRHKREWARLEKDLQGLQAKRLTLSKSKSKKKKDRDNHKALIQHIKQAKADYKERVRKEMEDFHAMEKKARALLQERESSLMPTEQLKEPGAPKERPRRRNMSIKSKKRVKPHTNKTKKAKDEAGDVVMTSSVSS
eukprot:gb/GEZN01019372.1/.p1 GENE.gb/GEZN01019372.1/~~gb/GEZN01019372.1/.p1  ORF type:complete len:202 (-),score=52.09 gb/GEZN01019372.1/:72-677(-)